MKRPFLILALCLAIPLGACTSAGAGSSTAARAPGHRGGGQGDSAPARDSFTGTIISGTGTYSHARGRVRVNLHPRGSGRARPTRVVVIGLCGEAQQGCTELHGRLDGTLSAAGARVPDVGHGFNLAGAGRVSPLGQVTLRGGVSGTGFIARGHEEMRITLSSRSGSVTVQAISGPVKGFSSP